MSTKAATAIGLPPGLNFHPHDDELVEFYLLPTARGEPAWFPGVIVIDDDTAGNTVPWKLLERHGLAGDDEAYFFVRTKQDDIKEATRQVRCCAGGARWVSQRPVFGASCIGGERIEWRRINLNLQMGRGRSGGGSGGTGWVMHEYALTEPARPSLKICHVSFSGHGKDRKRVPDEEYSEPASKRARVDAADANSGSSTCVYGSTAPAIDQGYGTSGDVFQQLHAGQQEHSLPFPIDQGISATDLQQQQPLPETNVSSATCAYEPMQVTDEQILEWGSSFADDDAEPTAEQQKTDAADSSSEICGYDDYEPVQVSDEEILDWGSSFLADEQLMIQETVADGAAESSDGISPSNQQQLQQLDSVPSMEVEERQEIQEEQFQLAQSSTTTTTTTTTTGTSFFLSAASAGAELYLEQAVPTTEQHQHLPAEYQTGGDEQEQRKFWRSIGVDIGNIVF